MYVGDMVHLAEHPVVVAKPDKFAFACYHFSAAGLAFWFLLVQILLMVTTAQVHAHGIASDTQYWYQSSTIGKLFTTLP